MLSGRSTSPFRFKNYVISVTIARTSLFLLALIFSINAYGQGNLLVTPRRVVFEGNKRSFDLNLANIGKDTATYAISFVQIRMKDDGGFEVITAPDPGQKFADQNLRFFPRQVTLAPNEAQVVKLQLLRTNQLAPGEYRSHLYFRSIPKFTARGDEKILKDTTTISVRLTPIFGITIPAIIRIGQPDSKVTMSDLSLTMAQDGSPLFGVKFHRTGNYSVYGDLAVDHVSPSGKVTRVGIANGIAVYTPNAVRSFMFNLDKKPEVNLKTGKLRVTFSAPSDVRPEKYAEAELLLK